MWSIYVGYYVSAIFLICFILFVLTCDVSQHCLFLELSSGCDVVSCKKYKNSQADISDESIIKMLPGEDNVNEMKSNVGRHESIQKSIM